MNQTTTASRDERLQKLFDDCQQHVLSQIIGPFGLSTAMFHDRNGGNVTTLHNFSREGDDYIAGKDKGSHAESRKEYDREEYSDAAFASKSTEKRSAGVDGYTGKQVAAADMDLDHVTALKTIAANKKAHLGLETGAGLERVVEMANADANLVPTHKSINRSKRDGSLDALNKRRGADFELDQQLVVEAQKKSEQHIASTIDTALLKKQGTELLQTGGTQAMQMGLRQALGVLLTELVQGLFNEVKIMIRHGTEAGQSLLDDIRARLGRVIASVAAKIPDALGQLFQGGVSGFMSNLLTFLLNNFLSTAKRFVTAIREGLLGLYRAFRMIFFPPKHLTAAQAMQEGLKILGTVVVTTLGVVLQESVSTFMATLPFLKPVADMVAPVLVGITTGLLSAFLAYQIDCLFDRLLHTRDEKLMDELMADATRRAAFAGELATASDVALDNVMNYARSIALYQDIGASLAASGQLSDATCASLQRTVAQTREQVARSRAMTGYIQSSQAGIEDFLKTI